MTKFKVTSGVLNGIPQSKILMNVTILTGVKKLDFGSLVFNPTGQQSRFHLIFLKNHIVNEKAKFIVRDEVNDYDVILFISDRKVTPSLC